MPVRKAVPGRTDAGPVRRRDALAFAVALTTLVERPGEAGAVTVSAAVSLTRARGRIARGWQDAGGAFTRFGFTPLAEPGR